ncbi:MAG: sensor histidine kinase [Alphaproteobacteria bacterium]|nr:sensor histidine kinase [Alphaproteobacteria bacterium]
MWLRGKINTALAICIGAPLALGFGAIWFGAQTTMREAGTHEIATATEAAAAAIEDRAGLNLRHLTAWSKLSVMQDVLIGGEGGELARTLAGFAVQYPDFANLVVTDGQGNIVASSANEARSSIAADEGFRTAASGRVYQSPLAARAGETKETLSFTVPLIARHDGQSVIGTLTGVLNFNAILKAVVTPTTFSADGNALILTKRDGHIVFASRTDATLFDALQSGRAGNTMTWRGDSYFVAGIVMKKKALPQDLGLTAVGVTPAAAILATTASLTSTFLIVASIAVIAAFALAWHWTTPLVDLGNAMDALARGNALYKGPKPKPTDAFAPMARAFEVLRQMKIVRDKLWARERDLSRAKETAEAALKAKSEHIASLSHALSEQLSTIVRLSDLINREALEAATGETRSTYAKEIASTGASLLSVINDLFDLSEVEAGHVTLNETSIDLTKLIAETSADAQPAAFNAQVTLGRDGMDAPLVVRCDAPKLKHAIANLLSNAVKFTPAGGRVTVHLKISGDGNPTIVVEDTGIGMAPALTPVAATLTDTKGHHGAGLGLPLARELVELHGGRLEIESETGKGTAVTITLPAGRLVATPAERLSA